MNNWLSEPASLANNNHAGFGSSNDPSMAFLQPPSTIDPSQFQNQRFLNGAARNGSPAFHNPSYQVNPVIPSKRQREDSFGTSPRQAPGALPGSRSQTPGQIPYPGYNSNGNGAPHFSNAPTPFQHLQTAPSSTATPSPTVQQLNFTQAGGPQRVATASPNAYSPHHGGPQMSPAHSEHVSRGGTPHDNPTGFMHNSPYGQGVPQQQFNPNLNMPSGQMQMNPQLNLAQNHMQAQGMSAQQRAYQMQIQAQARSQAAQGRPMSSGLNNPGMQMPNPQMAALQHQNKPNSPEEFVKNLQGFMASIGQTVNVNPVICERRLNVMQMFVAVVKSGGSARVTKLNQWPYVAQQFGFPPPQCHMAAQELRSYWMTNLAPYENMWLTKKQNKGQVQGMPGQPGVPNNLQNQMSPGRSGLSNHDQGVQNHQRSPSDAASMKMNGVVPNNFQQPTMNGYIPPSQLAEQSNHQQNLAHHKPNLSRQLDGAQMNGIPATFPTPSPAKRPESASERAMQIDPGLQMPPKMPIEDPFRPDVLPESRLHGSINIDEMFAFSHSLIEVKPTVPTFRELGVIDIHALIMSIKSGIHAEVRMALDTLTTLSVEQGLQLSLDNCDDLIETLIDCAQEQADFLAENAAEVSDEMLISSYEDVIRGCRVETESLLNIPEFGGLDYDLDRAVDRLICITTLIRNFSFYEANFNVLGMSEVVRFLTNVIRHLGTKEMLLRTNRNTLDFMKDVIIYLSNLSHSIQLPGKEEALCLLHFLLSFAPCPPPITASSDKITFTMYNPNIHKYTPSAVDSLAKLLARDEPNRTYYKSIYSADAASSPPYELLTRTFGLAISPLPVATMNPRAIVGARKPFLLQGMLAAEILSNLAPGSDHGLARSWLESTDGFAISLLRLVGLLSAEHRPQPPQRHPQGGRSAPELDADAYGAITHRAMAVLKRLVEKSRNGENGDFRLPAGIIPKKETLLGALVTKEIDAQVLKQLCTYSALDE
jgi:SWI/SNF chromatin-remodeling complex subunit SWI1